MLALGDGWKPGFLCLVLLFYFCNEDENEGVSISSRIVGTRE